MHKKEKNTCFTRAMYSELPSSKGTMACMDKFKYQVRDTLPPERGLRHSVQLNQCQYRVGPWGLASHFIRTKTFRAITIH